MYAPGATLGNRFRLEERIGGGGMGEVWRGTDEVLGRTVAVKVMLPSLVREPGFARRFLTEARALASIDHPRVVKIHDYHGDESDAFLVMEYVPGESLAQLLRRAGPLSPARTMELIAMTADALQAVHAKGMVHRDLKPGNIMVRPDGTVVLTDFGIVRWSEATQLTATNAVIGTAPYISPEQALGKPATAISDLYALGIIAYQCLQGQPPFDGESPLQVVLKHVREEPPALPAGIPPAVRAVIAKALVKDPEQRWQTAAELATAARRAAAAPDAPPAAVEPPAATDPPAATPDAPPATPEPPPATPEPPPATLVETTPPTFLPPPANPPRPGPPPHTAPPHTAPPPTPWPTPWPTQDPRASAARPPTPPRPLPMPPPPGPVVMPPPWWPLERPAPPATVRIACLLLLVAAACFAVYFLAVMTVYDTVDQVFRDAFSDSSHADTAGTAAVVYAVPAALVLIFGFLLLLLSWGNHRGSRGARGWTVALALIGLCCWGTDRMFGDSVRQNADISEIEELRAEAVEALAEQLPSWYELVTGTTVLAGLVALFAAAILLNTPASSRFFRLSGQFVYYRYHYHPYRPR